MKSISTLTKQEMDDVVGGSDQSCFQPPSTTYSYYIPGFCYNSNIGRICQPGRTVTETYVPPQVCISI
jgi:hypothetical protein